MLWQMLGGIWGCSIICWRCDVCLGNPVFIFIKIDRQHKGNKMTDNIDRAIDKMIQRSQREWHDGRESLLFAQAAMNLAKTKMLLSPGDGKSRLIFVEEDASHDS